ncbi:hypothetical protein BVG79_01976 [Ketogulonicigenium robustum]|uniref:Uncharacterized protein n=1 Tax=Ketogulonicigenium robustum TaxID=92947 RepID=A0A1W6P1C1_9RHOB|nr:hypothetical protein [Ketogulonicigenium robustum]ARO15318.1 hypothetical protein BVG79_01976 [Ketogulonicigenium robustum]
MQPTVISHAAFNLSRHDVLTAMQDQRMAVSAVVQNKTGLWRSLRMISVIVLIPTMIAGIWLSKQPYLPYGVALLLVFGVLFKVSDWRIKRGMHQLGARSTVSENRLVRTLDKQIFRGRATIPAEATFTETGFALSQGKVTFAADYTDTHRIGIIFERNGLLQIIPGDDRSLPDAFFFVPLSVMPNAAALMDKLRESPSFVFPRTA